MNNYLAIVAESGRVEGELNGGAGLFSSEKNIPTPSHTVLDGK